MRYLPFAESWTGGTEARDVGVEGAEREMGFDPESGRWVVRSVQRGQGEGDLDAEEGAFAK